MPRHRLLAASIALVLVAGACSSGDDSTRGTSKTSKSSAARATTTTSEPVAPADLGIDLADAQRCDPIVPDRCLLPFPNDHFTADAPDTETGRRVALVRESMPANAGGVHIEPTEWNRNDGFSPGSPILVWFPGADLVASGTASLLDPGRSVDDDSPVVIVDADTGERHPHWVETDPRAGSDAERSVIVRPLRDFVEGHRYVVAFRGMVDGAGKAFEPSPAFAALRDGLRTTDPAFESRRDHFEDAVFPLLEDAGVARDAVQLAWDFTVASADSIAGRVLRMRDDAFARLGDRAPTFTVDEVVDAPGPRVFRRVEGTFDVPSYLTGDGSPGSSLAYGDDGLPQVQAAGFVARYRCIIPPSAAQPDGGPTTPARVALYGHGLLGSFDELGSDMVEDMGDRYNVAYCATNWVGMAEEDIGNAAAVLGDLSTFGTIADRCLQGFLDFLFLGRLVKHPDGFATDPAFQLDGAPLIDPENLYYDGNSQGAILGGALMAIAQDFTRGVLGEAGMNYSTLLQRSVDFDDYRLVFDPAYPDAFDQQMALALIQMLWDRAETNGYAQHLTDDPYPDTPEHRILLLGAVGDHQVSEYALQVEARTIGARGHVPYVADDRARSADEHGWGIEPIDVYPFDGSAYFLFDTGSPLSPLDASAPREGHDPHDDTPNIPAAQELKDAFWQPDGAVIDVCDAGPCTGEPHD